MPIELPPQKPLPPKSAVDLQALAERIFRLMKQDARLEQERLGKRNPGNRKVSHGA